MERKGIVLFSQFKQENWRNLFLAALVSFYLSIFGFWVARTSFPVGYGTDYLAFWSAGKIADQEGYSDIYDPAILKDTQSRELTARGLIQEANDGSIPAIPSPYFSIFITPFQLLSRLDSLTSYWIWTILNLAALIGYLFFFMRRILPASAANSVGSSLILLMLVSFPVFKTFTEGQLNVLLLISVGEFIRNAFERKPFLSGVWLGGLLLKPQLLILLLPILLIQRYWKVLWGFAASTGVILAISFLLSGIRGMQGLLFLWTKWAGGNTVVNAGSMINWRMVGTNLSSFLSPSLAWGIAGVGIFLTLLAVVLLVKRRPPYGSAQWVLTMLGVFSATLAVTWHTHYHMALILIPFLIFAAVAKLLPPKFVFFWAVATPVCWLGTMAVSMIYFLVTRVNILDSMGMIVVLTGFLVNLALLAAVVRYSNKNNPSGVPISAADEGNPI